jgi:hypothetical protein
MYRDFFCRGPFYRRQGLEVCSRLLHHGISIWINFICLWLLQAMYLSPALYTASHGFELIVCANLLGSRLCYLVDGCLRYVCLFVWRWVDLFDFNTDILAGGGMLFPLHAGRSQGTTTGLKKEEEEITR